MHRFPAMFAALIVLLLAGSPCSAQGRESARAADPAVDPNGPALKLVARPCDCGVSDEWRSIEVTAERHPTINAADAEAVLARLDIADCVPIGAPIMARSASFALAPRSLEHLKMHGLAAYVWRPDDQEWELMYQDPIAAEYCDPMYRGGWIAYSTIWGHIRTPPRFVLTDAMIEHEPVRFKVGAIGPQGRAEREFTYTLSLRPACAAKGVVQTDPLIAQQFASTWRVRIGSEARLTGDVLAASLERLRVTTEEDMVFVSEVSLLDEDGNVLLSGWTEGQLGPTSHPDTMKIPIRLASEVVEPHDLTKRVCKARIVATCELAGGAARDPFTTDWWCGTAIVEVIPNTTSPPRPENE